MTGQQTTKTILSTQSANLRVSQNGELQNQFIRVGLGNIDALSVIEDGDIQNYPVKAYYSNSQRCTFTQKQDNTVTIYSEVQAPNRYVLNVGHEFKPLKFQTLISFSTYEVGDIANVHTYQLDPSGDPRGDFDFIETIFDSP